MTSTPLLNPVGRRAVESDILLGMGKGIWAATIALGAVVAADQYFNSGYYTDAALVVLRQIRHSFGW